MMTDQTAPADPFSMITFHSALRRDLARARNVLGTGELSLARRATLGRHLMWLVGQLRWHHEGEDNELWSTLCERNPDLQHLLSEMEHEHAAIDEPLAAFESAARGLVAGWCAEQTVLRALSALETPLLDHLRHEEQKLLPEVTRLMTRKDWADFEHRGWSRGYTPFQGARFIAWITDGSSWTREEMSRLGLPEPVYLLLLRPLSWAFRTWRPNPWRRTEAAGTGPLAAEEYAT